MVHGEEKISLDVTAQNRITPDEKSFSPLVEYEWSSSRSRRASLFDSEYDPKAA